MGGLIYVDGPDIFFWDADGDTWSTIATDVAMGEYHNFAEYNAVHHVMILGGGNDSNAVYVLRSDRSLTRVSDAPFPLRVIQSVVTVDPISGDHIVLGGGDGEFGGEMWVYDVVTDSWSRQPDSFPAFFNERGIADLLIAGPIDSYGVIMFVKHAAPRSGSGEAEAQVWLYKHSPGMGLGRPDGGVDSGTGRADGSAGDGGESEPDASTPAPDAGSAARDGTPPGADPGCACRVGSSAQPPVAIGALSLLALTLMIAGARRRLFRG
jgi:hypothetical protein